MRSSCCLSVNPAILVSCYGTYEIILLTVYPAISVLIFMRSHSYVSVYPLIFIDFETRDITLLLLYAHHLLDISIRCCVSHKFVEFLHL
jgi:hypothetical protein